MLPLFIIYFSTVPLSYSYCILVDSIGITDSSDATFAHDDDHFQTQRVFEKGTRCNENNLMSFCLAIITD